MTSNAQKLLSARITEPKSLVASAIARGLIHLPEPTIKPAEKFDPAKCQREYRRRRMAKFKAQGLNWQGRTPLRTVVPRPELAGLHQRTPEEKRAYHRLYMRLRRKGTIE